MYQNGADDGVYGYKDLPKAGATVHEDTTDVASYSYDASKRELISFDTPKIAKLKAQYVQSKGLAGAFFWDVRRTPSSPGDTGAVADVRLFAASSPTTSGTRTRSLTPPRACSAR